MDAPNETQEGQAEDAEGGYWTSRFGPARPVLPFVLGCAPFVAFVAFLGSYHTGKDPEDALPFAATTLLRNLIATELTAAFGATIFALFHPRTTT